MPLPLLSALPLLSVLVLPFFDLWADLQLVILILVYLMLYWVFSDTAGNPLLALVIATVVFFVLALPYEWIRVFLFITLVFMKTFQHETIKPWEW